VFVGRYPFAGPAWRYVAPSEIIRGKRDIRRKADAVYIHQIRKAGLCDSIWQALLPVKTVGVMGRGRSYGIRRVLVSLSNASLSGRCRVVRAHEFAGPAQIIVLRQRCADHFE
jgi:GMP synthase (glutamine-hydrolysing)